MTYTKLLVAVGLLVSTPTLANAGMSLTDMQRADALAKVISRADQCGYSIDDAKLEAYYAKSGLDSPELFSHITNLIDLNSLDATPTKAECTMARLTGKKIGILAP